MGIFLASFALVLLYTGGCVSECPSIPCPAIEYPPSCKVTVFGIKDGVVCQFCDACIEQTSPTDENGCPGRACNMIAIPPGCKINKYFTFNDKICEDCPLNACDY